MSVDAASTIEASAQDEGHGGKVIVWADGTTAFAGTMDASGGALSGDGGFVETSGHEELSFSGRVDWRRCNARSPAATSSSPPIRPALMPAISPSPRA